MTELRASLAGIGARIEWPHDVAAAADPLSGRGRLAGLATWLAAVRGGDVPQPPTRPRLVVLGPVAAAARAVADSVAAGVRGLEPGRDAFADGAAAADAEIDEGADLLVVAAGNRPADHAAASVVVGLTAGAEPVALLPRGAAAVDTAAWITRAEYLRDTRRAVAATRTRPDDLLAALGNDTLLVAAGFLITASARRTPVVLDGLVAVAAALLCQDTAPAARLWWQVADTSSDPAHARAVDELDRDPLLHLGTSSGDGVAGLLAVPLLRAAAVGDTP